MGCTDVRLHFVKRFNCYVKIKFHELHVLKEGYCMHLTVLIKVNQLPVDFKEITFDNQRPKKISQLTSSIS